MDKWFNNKWFVRVASLAFAIVLYVFVNIEMTSIQSEPRVPSSSNDVETLEDVPVDIRIDGDEYVVSGVPDFVTVRLEGPSSVLIPTVRQRNFDVFVDLEGLGEGDHTVEIEDENVPNGLSIYIEPKKIPITIEERATEEFSVLIDYINLDELPVGYELGDADLSPETISITSSKSVIDQIAMVKVYLDVADLTEPINNREVPVNVYDSQGNGLDVRTNPERVVVSLDVLNPSKTVSVKANTVNELPEGYELTSITVDPDEIEVFATTSVLEDIDELVTEEIDLSSITESDTIEVDILIPDDVTIEEDKITVEIELEQTVEIEDISIDVENLGVGQDIQFLSPADATNRMTIKGPEEKLREIDHEDFQLSIDVENLPEGEHEIPVTIEGPEDDEDVSVEMDMEEVTINIT